MMKRLNFADTLAQTTRHLPQGGIFLSVGGDAPNTMTIGWAGTGSIWGKDMFIAMVRPQRHTYDLLMKLGEFTVSVPTKSALRKELAFAGAKSGRDVDKFSGHGLTAVPGQVVSAPIVGECGLHYECRVLLTQPTGGEMMDKTIHDRCYPQDDFHILFFGEVVACYTTDE